MKEPVERRRVQKKRKEKKWKKKRKKKKKKVKHRRSRWWKKGERKYGESLYNREERRKERKGRPKEKQTSQSETSLGKVWKVALSLLTVGAELVVCQCCSGRIEEKDGDHGRMQQQESRWAEEIPHRLRQSKGEDRTEMRKEAKIIKVYLAQWIGLEYRAKIHKKIQRKMRYFLGERAQAEKRGNGGAVR